MSGSSLEETLARLAKIRIERERLEAAAWCLEREADELRTRVRLLNAQQPAVAERAA
jgi:hypothetical protein